MRRILFSLVFLFLFVNIFAQNQKARKFEEFTDFCCEATRDVFDRFFREIQNNLDSKGYIVFYEGRNHPICNKNRVAQRGEIDLIAKIFENHVSFRNQNPDKFSWIKGGYREYWTAEFWIVPNSAELPKPTPTIEQKNIKFKKGKAKRLNLHCEP